MSSSQREAARRLRDQINAAGVRDDGQYGVQEVSLSQVAKVLDTAQGWAAGRFTVDDLCATAGWVAP